MASQGASLDQILENYVGGVGLYQILVTVALYHASWGGLSHVYTAYAPDHRCRVSECEKPNQLKVRIKPDLKNSKNSFLNPCFGDFDPF